MKKGLFVLLLVLSNGICFAQNAQRVAELKHELSTAKQDTSRALIMARLCFAYNYSLDPDSSLYYGEAAYALAHKIHFARGEVVALGFESFIQSSLGNLPRQMELALKALQIAKDNHAEQYSGAALQGIAGIYSTLKDYPKALHYLRQMDALNGKGKGYAELGISSVFSQLNQPDSAIYYLKRGDSLLRSKGTIEAGFLGALGDIKMKSGDYPAALNLYRKSLRAAIQNKELRDISYLYNKIAALYQKTNQSDSAIFYAKKGLATAHRLSQRDEILEAAALLAKLYEPTNTKTALRYYKMADAAKDSLHSSENIQAIETIIQQEQERQQSIEANRIAYKNKLKEYALIAGLVIIFLIAISLLKNSRNKRKANIVLQQKNKEIETQRDNLESTLSELKSTQKQLIQSEKMASLGELTAGIAHEIQNPLNFVNNFSEVNTELLGELKAERSKPKAERDDQSEDEIINDVIANSEKIIHHGKRADAIVKGMLQHSRISSGKKEPTNINALADEYFRLSYHGMRAKDKSFNATMKTDFDETVGKIAVVPQDIGRVFLNLFNNAFYAVSERKQSEAPLPPEGGGGEVLPKREPTVWVSTKRIADGIPPSGGTRGAGAFVEIRVKDNGNGIPEKIKDKIFQPFFTTKPTGEGTGLGLSLSYDMVKAHGGEITVNSVEGEGTEFVVVLPV